MKKNKALTAKKKKDKKGRLIGRFLGLGIFIIFILVIVAGFLPISSPQLTDFVNKRVNQELKAHKPDANFKVEGVTIRFFHRIEMNKLNITDKGTSLQSDKVRVSYNLLDYLRRRKIPVNLFIEDVSLRLSPSAESLALGDVFQEWRRFLRQGLKFNTIEVALEYGSLGLEWGRLEAQGEDFNITGRGRWGPYVPLDYQLRIISPSLSSNKIRDQVRKFLFASKGSGQEVVIIEFEGDYRNPRAFLVTKFARVPLNF